ncbi:MAG: PAS domain S-box protein [Pirellulales bacterium]|nr:PAS domain S-box protein [Pirellulales bacterium]
MMITERQQDQSVFAEDRLLKEVLFQLQLTYDQSPVGMLQMDLNMRYVRLNAQMAAMNGIPAADHIGKTLSEIVPDLAPKIEPAFRRVIETGEPLLNVELEGETPADPGVTHTWLESWFPLRDSRGQVIGLNVVAQDITEKKRLEAELRENQARQEFLLRFSDELRAINQPAQIKSRATTLLGGYLKVNRATYFKIEGEMATVEGAYHQGVPPFPESVSYQSFGDFFHSLRSEGGLIIVENVAKDGRFSDQQRENYAAVQTTAYLAVLLYKQNTWVGAVSVESASPRRWTLAERQLVQDVAERTWNALERAQAESDLRASQERLVELANAMPQIVYVTDPSGSITFINQQWQIYTGQIGATSELTAQMIHPEDYPATLALWDTARTAKAPYSAQFRMRRYDGEFRWFLTRAVPVKNSNGEIDRWFGTSTEIHEQKRVEEELKSSSQRLVLALDSAQMGSWDWNILTNEVIWSEKTRELFGVPPDVPITFDLFESRLHPPDIEPNRQKTSEALSTGEYESEFRVLHGNGGYRWIGTRGRLLRDTQGKPLRMLGVVQDITERKQAVESLREREALFRTLGEAVPDFLWMSDGRGNPEYQNPAWKKYTGSTHEELKQRGWDIIHHPDDIPRLRQLWAWALEHGQAISVEARTRRYDGEYRWFAGRTVPLKDDAGNVLKWVGTMTDIHDLKMAEAALRDSARRKDEFLATLAHELRNPLAPLRNGLQLMKLAEHDQRLIAETRQLMDRQISHLVRLVDDLLDISRISQGKIELKVSSLKLAEIVRQAVETSRPLIEQMEHHLSVELPVEPISLSGDLTRLAQMLANLLNNAAKYTPRGGKIRLTATATPATVELTVSDNGVGIPAEMLPHVFEMFTQVDRSLEHSQGGLGIGLSLVRRMVELHGGKVTATSGGHGQGSSFTVFLPRGSIAAAVGDPASAQEAHHFPRQKILVVDDNTDAAESLALMLRMMGHTTQTAHDGRQALSVAEQFLPHVMILDIGMPHLNGFDAARHIRAAPWGRDIILVALTGWGQPEDRFKSRAAGFDLHLVKPFQPEELFNFLKSLNNENASPG